MLQLLLEGGQSYADIGALLGVEPAEVKSRARRALAELGGVDPDSQVGLTDYLLGQADPIGRADAARQLQSDPGTADLATKLATQLRVIAPKARLPELPGHVGAAPLAAPAPGVPTTPSAAAPAAGPGAASRAAGAVSSGLERIGGAVSSLGDRDRRLPVALGLTALLIVVVVLVVVNPFGGGDENGGTSTSAAADDLEVVKLEPQNGSGASGQAVIARVQDQPVLQINLSNLQPTGKDQNYIVWLYASEQVAFPLARDQVGSDGTLTGAAAIPSALIGLLPQFKAIDVSLASNAQTQQALQDAAKAQQLPPHSGTSVLRGTINNIPPSVSELGNAGGASGTSTGAGGATGTGIGGASTTP